jgi:UDP-2,3-diacylglucosamine pyrophosphatase LpxH
MKKTIFVISDLHLGGGDGFQMCSPAGQANLAAFIRWAKGQHSEENAVRLIINGDFVDFLAEEPFAEFTNDDTAATDKLQQVIDRTQDVWDALAEFVASGAALTILLGNHDIELSLPGPRRLLLKTLGEGRVEFIYDGQAFVDGPVIVEHGNRYDPWNIVPHDSLGEVRAALSRHEPPPQLKRIPGSAMVNQIINPLKEKHPFIDLLKPENEAMIPLLVVLDPSCLMKIRELGKLPLLNLATGTMTTYRTFDRGDIGAPVSSETKDFDEALRFAENLVTETPIPPGLVSRGDIGAWKDTKSLVSDFLSHWHGAVNEKTEHLKAGLKAKKIEYLFKALRFFAGKTKLAFDVDHEAEGYLSQAQRLADKGFQVVVFGHTHLAKRVPLKTATGNGAVYLNSGTWADLMRLPDDFFLDDETKAKQSLIAFADDLASGDFGKWRRRIPTFAKVELWETGIAEASVFRFDPTNGQVPVQEN